MVFRSFIAAAAALVFTIACGAPAHADGAPVFIGKGPAHQLYRPELFQQCSFRWGESQRRCEFNGLGYVYYVSDSEQYGMERLNPGGVGLVVPERMHGFAIAENGMECDPRHFQVAGERPSSASCYVVEIAPHERISLIGDRWPYRCNDGSNCVLVPVVFNTVNRDGITISFDGDPTPFLAEIAFGPVYYFSKPVPGEELKYALGFERFECRAEAFNYQRPSTALGRPRNSDGHYLDHLGCFVRPIEIRPDPTRIWRNPGR